MTKSNSQKKIAAFYAKKPGSSQGRASFLGSELSHLIDHLRDGDAQLGNEAVLRMYNDEVLEDFARWARDSAVGFNPNKAIDTLPSNVRKSLEALASEVSARMERDWQKEAGPKKSVGRRLLLGATIGAGLAYGGINGLLAVVEPTSGSSPAKDGDDDTDKSSGPDPLLTSVLTGMGALDGAYAAGKSADLDNRLRDMDHYADMSQRPTVRAYVDAACRVLNHFCKQGQGQSR